MLKFKRPYITPFSISAFLVISLAILSYSIKSHQQRIISGDMLGYHSYLPNFYLSENGNYEETLASLGNYTNPSFNQAFLFKTANDRVYNKYFPGIAILQTPFFLLGSLFAWIFGYPVDGYSPPFYFFHIVGSTFYFLIGIWFFLKSLNILAIPTTNRFLIVVLLIASPLLYYGGYFIVSHSFSAALISIFLYLVLVCKEQFNVTRLFFLGLSLGMIFLVRPTNILVVLMIPFLLESWKNLRASFLQLSSSTPFISALLIGFVIPIFLLLANWKWQTGNWIFWSYHGEGFDFLHPKIWSSLFSFRIGLFLHTPLLFGLVISTLLLAKKKRFQFVWWWIYFGILTWVYSSWWCWDYESVFGNRVFTEHLLLLSLPLFISLKKIHWRWITFFSLVVLIGGVRLFNLASSKHIDQRFTKENYLSSLCFWKGINNDRWSFSLSCQPNGENIDETIVLDYPDQQKISSHEVYSFSSVIPLNDSIVKTNLYYRAEIERQTMEGKFEGIYFVIDATDAKSNKRHYELKPLFNDRLCDEKWEKVIFEGRIPDHFNEFDEIKLYIWNKGKKQLNVRNVHYRLFRYYD